MGKFRYKGGKQSQKEGKFFSSKMMLDEILKVQRIHWFKILFGEYLFVSQEMDKGQNKFGEGLENVLGAKQIQKCTNATVLQIHTYIQIHQKINGCDTKHPEQLLADMSSVPFIN